MKVILFMAMTLNGYIAKENNEAPWSDTVWKGYYDFIKERKNIVLGRTTYEMMKEVNEFEKLENPFTIVVTKTPLDNTQNTVFVSSPKEAVEICGNKGMSEMVIGGGSTLNTAFLEQNLIDEVYIDIEPQVFGKGIKLFGDIDIHSRLDLIEVKKLTEGIVRLHYQFIK
ncbi:MAG: dihydrofolate reductase family protein [Patescibacteria group bacterium]